MTTVTPARAALLSLVLLIAACSTATPRTTASAGAATPMIVVTPTEPREQTADQQVQQVLNRLGFGPRPGDVTKVRTMGVDHWIALQLAPDRIDDGAADRIVASYEMLGRPTSDFVAMYGENQLAVRKAGRLQRILGDVQSAKLARAVSSERQLQEVLTDFWENHFTVFAGKGQVRLFIPAYDRDVIRPNAMGKFRDLLGAVARSPAMLFYLDQWQSAADSVHPTLVAARQQRPGRRMMQQRAQPGPRGRRGLNENYARELLELHTLGVDGGYTQQDIIEVARALTGWTMNPRGAAEFTFRPEIHDAGKKVVLGHALPAGRGIEDGEAVLDILARHPATAHFVARKLATRFVSDAPPPALVDRAAQTFIRTDGDIREVVRTIVTSPEFFARSAYRAKVKSPFELVASALRTVGAQADTTVRSAQLVAFLGAPMFGHQAPNGWPETGEAWMNSGSILNRINFGLGLAAGRFPGAGVATWSDAERLKHLPRESQVDAVVLAFFGGQVSPDTRQILLSGENPLATKLAAGVPLDSVSSDKGIGRPVQLNGLAQVIGLAIGAPEFQRR